MVQMLNSTELAFAISVSNSFVDLILCPTSGIVFEFLALLPFCFGVVVHRFYFSKLPIFVCFVIHVFVLCVLRFY